VWFLLAFWMVGPELVLRSATVCPAAADVAAEMTPLLPAGTSIAIAPALDPPGVDRAELVVADGIRWVRLIGSDGRTVQERPLPASVDCAEAARSAAVLLAAWQFQGHGELPAAAAPAASKPPAPAPLLAAAGPASLAPSPTAANLSRSGAAATGAQAASAPAMLAIGAEASLGASGDSRPVGGAAELLFGKASGPGLRAQVGATFGYSIPIADGRATWNRVSAGLGPMFQIHRGAWGAAAHADVQGARLGISGDDRLPAPRGGSQLALGVGGGARALRDVGPLAMWLDATVMWWPGNHEVFLLGSPADSRALPQVEVTVALGTYFFLWR